MTKMIKKFQFIGNEEDKRTKEWGLKYGKVYEIEARQWILSFGYVSAVINTPNCGRVHCPYKSRELFDKNWRDVDLMTGAGYGNKHKIALNSLINDILR